MTISRSGAWNARAVALALSLVAIEPEADARLPESRSAGAPRAQRVLYAGSRGYPPFEYVDADGTARGFNVELIRALAAQAGIEVEIRLGDWKTGRQQFEAGEVDLMAMVPTRERERQYDYLDEIWTQRHVVAFVGQRRSLPRGLDDLAREAIAVTDGTIMHETLRSIPEARRPALRAVATQTAGINAVLSGEATAVAGESLALGVIAAGLGAPSLAELPVKASSYHFVTQRGRRSEFAWIARGLAGMRRRGEFAGVVERTLAVPAARVPWRRYAAILALALGAALTLGIVAWNGTLRREVGRQTHALQDVERALRASDERLRRQNEALLRLAHSDALARGELGQAFRELTEVVAHTGEVERVGIWLSDDQRASIRCADRFERVAGRHTLGDELLRSQAPAYFDALETGQLIAANDADTDPRTRQLREAALVPLGVTAMLHAPIHAAGRTLGVVSHDHVGSRREWTLEEQNFARSAAELAARALEAQRRRNAEAERERAISDLAAKNAELERFTYTVSHDLKSPLITIRSYLSQLGRCWETRDAERFEGDLARITGAAQKMTQLLDDLLELSRIGRIIHTPVDVPLQELAGEAVAMVKGRLAGRGVSVEIAEGLPVVRGDRPRLLQVFQNLVDNASKFAGEERQPRVQIGVRSDGAQQVLFVRDNGIGVEPQYHEKIFGLFDKLDPKSEGTGVGLALVRRIVEGHGGRIWVESSGKASGSTFCFTLYERPPS